MYSKWIKDNYYPSDYEGEWTANNPFINNLTDTVVDSLSPLRSCKERDLDMKAITKNINGTKKNVDKLTSKLDRLDAAIAKMEREKGLRFDETNSKTAVKAAAQAEVKTMATASAPEKKLSPEQVDYVVEKISEEDLDKASVVFAEEFRKRFIGNGKAVSLDNAMKIAKASFKMGYKYATIKDIKKILK